MFLHNIKVMIDNLLVIFVMTLDAECFVKPSKSWLDWNRERSIFWYFHVFSSIVCLASQILQITLIDLAGFITFIFKKASKCAYVLVCWRIRDVNLSQNFWCFYQHLSTSWTTYFEVFQMNIKCVNFALDTDLFAPIGFLQTSNCRHGPLLRCRIFLDLYPLVFIGTSAWRIQQAALDSITALSLIG